MGFGRTRETKTPGTYNVVFSYTEENVGLLLESSVAIAEALIAGTDYDLNADLQKMHEIRNTGSAWAKYRKYSRRSGF
jgi:cyanophycin synthetase